MSSVFCENNLVAVLAWNCPMAGRRVREVRNGERLFVGSDEASDVPVADERVAAVHCVISAESGCLTVRDCYSQAGTFVDDSRIREIQLTRNAEISVGPVVIIAQVQGLNSAVADQNGSHPPAAESAVQSASPASPELSEEAHRGAAAEPPVVSPLQQIDDLQLQLEQAHAEIEVLHRRLETASSNAQESAQDPYQEEMLELLRSEITDLQTALAERDQRDTELGAGGDMTAAQDTLPQEDAEKLVSRLEDLLLELQLRDEQIATLTGLLEATEEASQAEQEERRQVDAWLMDIERKLGQREQEWQAERNALQQQLTTLASERDSAEAAVNADTSSAKLEAAKNVMTGLRQTVETQRQQLQESEQARAALQRELEDARTSQSREEQVRLAEERAEIARLRQELETARQRDQKVHANEAVLKLQALRQHLNEIHEQERKEIEERKLSSRLTRLWRRLDGR
ncbi:MAG: FHA domain-containing protein [Fuerstiella sp.]